MIHSVAIITHSRLRSLQARGRVVKYGTVTMAMMSIRTVTDFEAVVADIYIPENL